MTPEPAAPPPPPDLLAGFLTRKQMQGSLVPGKQVSDRTIIRWEHAGMPVIRVGALRLYDPARVREWLLSHEQRHEPPKRGRPTKRAA